MDSPKLLGATERDWEHPQQHLQPSAEPSFFPDSNDLKISAYVRGIHHEIKNCEYTRPQNQVSTAKKQHKNLNTILQEASTTLHTVLLGVDGTIYNTRTIESFKDLGLSSQRAQNLTASSTCILPTMLLNLSIPGKPFPVPLPTLIMMELISG